MSGPPAPGARRSGRLGELALVLASLALVFGALELATRLLVDTRERYRIAVYDVDRETGLAFHPGRERVYETSEFRYTLATNRFGRRDAEWTPEAMADPANLLFIGDSFVLGIGLEQDATVPSLLEEQLDREVFNYSMPAVGPPQYLELLKRALGEGIAARQVLVGIFIGNDFEPSVFASRAPAEPGGAPAPGDGAPRSELLRLLKQRVTGSARTVGWALTVGRWLGVQVYDTSGSYVFLRKPTPEQTGLFERSLDHVRQMRELAGSHGRRLDLVVFPNKIQVENYEDLEGAIFDPTRPNRRILELCRELSLACLDLLPVLRSGLAQSSGPLYYPIDRHLNQRGARLAAEAIAGFLEGAAAPAQVRS